MNVEDLRKQVSSGSSHSPIRWELIAVIMLAAALVLSVATAFAPKPELTAGGAVVLLMLSLVFGRTFQRIPD